MASLLAVLTVSLPKQTIDAVEAGIGNVMVLNSGKTYLRYQLPYPSNWNMTMFKTIAKRDEIYHLVVKW